MANNLTQREGQRPLFEPLEEQVLYSADALGGLDAVLVSNKDDPVLEASLLPTTSAANAADARITAVSAEHGDRAASEVVFIDTDTPNYQQLVDDLTSRNGEDRQFDVFVLDNERDGIAQISDILSGYDGLDAVHIISHGTDGSVDLGGSRLDAQALVDQSAQVGSWADAFSESGDFLIYGCDLAASAGGQQFVDSLANLTGADVAASDDLTGSAALGGDWELEYASGSVEAGVAMSAPLRSGFAAVLTDATSIQASFQQGGNGYAGTQDTQTDEDLPDTSRGSQTTFSVDLNGGDSGGQVQGLIRFDNLFGTGPGQIPFGSIINSATLTLNATNASEVGAQVALHQMLTSWNEASTWNSTGGGVQTDDVEAAAASDSVLTSPETLGTQTFSGLESRLQAWADGAINNGWVIVQDSTNGIDFSSSEDGTISLRPMLTVDYTPPDTAGLWLTTEEDVASPSGVDGLNSWTGGSILSFDDPTLSYAPGVTDGTLSNVFNLDMFVQDGDSRLDAIHYVGSNMTVGTNAVPLQAGDILLSSVFPETLVNSDTSTLSVTSRDVVIFRPDSLTDYSLGGTFIKLIDGADLAVEIEGVTLVESQTTIGSGAGATTLNPGDFLFTDRANTGDIFRLQPGVLGDAATNTGTTSLLVNGTAIGTNERIHGVELVETDVVVGDRALTSGQLLISIYADDVVAGTPVSSMDIFVLDLIDTGPATTATVTPFFVGGDIGFDTWQESPWAVSLVPAANEAPIANADDSYLVFDGNDIVRIANDPALQVTSTLTMEARFNLDASATGSQMILNKEGEYEVGINADTGELRFAIAQSDNTWAWHNTGYFVTPGEWTHVAVTYDGVAGEAHTYVNGELVDTLVQSGNVGDVYPGFDDLTIGGRENDADERFLGQIDDVRVWNTARSGAEINANYNDVLTGSESGLAGYWRLDGVVGTQVSDLTANNNDGVLGGAEGAASAPVYDGYSTDQNSTLVVAAGQGVLANDTDQNGDNLSVTNLDASGLLGNLVMNTADGSFTYDPNGAFDHLREGEVAYDTFSYSASDGTTDSNIVTVTIAITGTEDAPTAASNTVTTNEATAYTFSAADFNFSDVDGDTLASVQITSLETAGSLQLSGGDVTLNQVISIADIDAGNLVFVPASNENGLAYDTFDFRVSDGVSLGTPGTVLSSFPSASINSMSSIAFDGSSLWLTSPNDGAIYNYDTAGNLITSFASPGTYPTGITFDGTNLWVVDRDANTIYEIDTLGNVQSSFATPGTDSRGLTWDGSSLWLVEGNGSLIYELSTTGSVLSSFGWPSDFLRDITWDGSSLWVADENDQQIIELNTSGTVLSSFSTPSTGATGLTFDGTSFWHSDGDADTVYQLTTSNSVQYSAAAYTMTVDVAAVNDAPRFTGAPDGNVITDIPNSSETAYDVAVQDDGKIVVAGFSWNGTDYDFTVTRYNADGTLDTTFGGGDGIATVAIGSGDDNAYGMTLQPDGKILVTGVSDNGADMDFALTRLNTDGTLDLGFGTGGSVTTDFVGDNDYPREVVVQDDGKIVIAGHARIGGTNNFAVVRYNSDGTLDNSFGGDGRVSTDVSSGLPSHIRDVTLQSDGKIVVIGDYQDGSGSDFAIVRYNTDGTLDTSWGGDGIVITAIGPNTSSPQAISVQPNGKVVAAGSYYNGTDYEFAVVRYDTNGTLDSSFGGGDGIAEINLGPDSDAVTDMALQTDGKIVLAGRSNDGSTNDFAVARLNNDGSIDTSFGGGDGFAVNATGSASDIPYGMALQPDGSIVLAGYNYGTYSEFALQRYTPDGNLDTTFGFVNTLDGASGYTLGGPAVILDADVQVFDVELSAADDFSGASLTLVRNGGASVDDIFSATGNLGPLTEGSSLVLSGITVGTVTSNSAGTLTLQFNANATQARIDETLQSIAYANSGSAPVNVQIDWTFDDGNSGAQGTGGALQVTGSTTVAVTHPLGVEQGLIFSTLDDVSNSAAPGLADWTEGEVLQFSDPTLTFGPGGTSGTLASVLDLNAYFDSGDVDIAALHYVTTSITVGSGANTFDLQAGDVLFALDADQTIGATTYHDNDVLVFRPDSAGDYSSGTVSVLLESLSTGDTRAITLVERDTLVGDVTLLAGTFLYSDSASPSEIQHFDTTGVGIGSTTGTRQVFLNATGAFNIGSDISGLELIEVETTIGGETLAAGTLLASVSGAGSIGDNSLTIDDSDIVSLTVASTMMGSSTSEAVASMFMDGSNVALSSSAQDIDALSLTGGNNVPVATGNTVTASEDLPLVIDESAFSFTDGENDSLVSVTITGLNLNGGTLTHSGGSVSVTNGMTVTAAQLADLTFTSALNDSTDSSFTYTVNDSGTGVISAVMNIVVNAVDDAASITGDLSFSGDEGDAVVGDLNATDVEGLTDGTIFSVTAPATHGSATIDPATGAWSFTPTDSNWFGSDSFTVTVTDDLGGTTTQVISVTLANVDDAATITGDLSFSGNEGDAVAGDLDATDAEGLTDGTIYSVTAPATHGTATIDPATGAWSFTPTDSNWFGSDSFTVTVTDDLGGTTTQVVNITLANVDDPAVITGDVSFSGNEGDSVTGDLDATDVEGLTDGTIYSVTAPATHGTASIDPATGIWSFTPTDSNWFGSDSFTVTVTDDLGGTTTQVVSITLAAVNDAPVVVTNNPLSVPEESTRTITSVFLAATDVDNSAAELTYSLTQLPGGSGSVRLNGSTLSLGGTFTQDDIDNNRVTFRFGDDASITSFRFTVSDGNTTSSEMTFTVNGTPVNDAPVNSVPGTQVVDEETPTLVSGISITDIDAGGASLTTRLQVTAGILNVTLAGSASISAGGNDSSDLTIMGTVADINATLMTLTYTGDTDVTGVAADSLTVTTDDGGNTGSGGALQDVDVFQIDITNVDDPAVISGDVSFSGNEGDAVAGDLNATDVEGLTDGTIFSVTAPATHGTASIDPATGAWSFTPTDSNWFGSDSFTVTVTDDLGGTTTQVVSVTLANVDDAAVITGDVSFSGNEGDAVSGDLNASDVEGLTDGTIFSVTAPATHGTATIDPATGAWSFTPTDSNWFGSDSFTVIVTDDLGGTTNQVVSVTLANVDDAAVITGDVSFSGNEGDAVAGDLNATDVEGLTDGTIFSVTAPATHGTASIDPATGAWSFTPTDSNWFGSDSFTVTVTDDLGGTTTQVVSVTLANVDDAAVITGDVSFSGNEGDAVSGDLNASDVEGLTDGTIFSVTAPATHGTATIDPATGAWSFTPTDSNWFGSDSFTVIVTDDLGGTTNQVVSVTLANVDDAAVITGDVSFSGNEGDAVTGDLDATDVEGLTDGTIFSVTAPATHGTATIDPASGAWTFTPTDSNWFGSDSFTVTVTDDLGGTTTQVVSVTLANVDDAAVITGDVSFSGNEGDAVAGDLNATDVEGLTDGTIFSVTAPATHGTATIDPATGAWSFTPTDSNWFGSDSFTVTVTDDLGGATTQVVSVTLANVDDAAVITGDVSFSGNEGDPATGDLDATDVEGLTDGTIFSVTAPATHGTATIDPATGAWSFTPTDSNWFGSDSFTVIVTDDLGGTTNQVVSVTLANVDDAAVITGDVSFSGNEGDAVTGDLDATDVEGLTDGTIFSVTAPATHGTATIDPASGAWTFTPTDSNWFGSDSFTVTVTDDLGGTTNQVVSVTLANVDDAAVITGDVSFSGNEGDAVTGDLDATDVEGLTDGTIFSVTAAATHGTASIDPATGAWSFTPTDSNWFGSDSFTVTVTDDLGGTTTQVVSVTLANVDDAAVITGDVSFSGNEGDAVSGDLNATDVEGLTDGTIYSVTSPATHGSAAIDPATGAWSFTPTDSNWFGSDSFTVTVTDDLGGTTNQVVSVTLANVDDAAVITGDVSFSGNEGDAVSGDLNASDVEGLTDGTIFSVTAPATHGTASIDPASGAWSFTPTDSNWFGSDSFTVTVTDDLGGTTTQVVSVTLANVDDAAVITGDVSFSGNEGDPATGDLDATDVEGLTDGTIFSVTAPATHGTASIDPATGAWSFTPTDSNWFGSDSFTVTVTDDLGGTTTQVISVTLANVDDAAVITGDVSFSGNEGDPVTGDLDATDVEGLTDGTIFSVTAPATHGTASIDPTTGAWSFTPTDSNWFGSDSFTVTVTDDLGGTTTQVVSITLANVDDVAVITGDVSFSGNEGDAVSGDLNATDVEGLTDGTIFSVTAAATQGTASIDPATGAWSFTPTDSNWFGSDSFTVTVTDDLGGTTTQVISVTLANVDDAANITGDVSFSGNEGDAVAGDLDATDAEGLTDGTIYSVTSPATHGSAAIDPATGAWSFTPTDSNWFGSDSFTVTVTDDLGGTTTQVISVTLANVDDAAVITGDVSFSGNERDAVTGDLDATDVEGLTDGTIFSVTAPATHGTASIDPATGAWSFTPTDSNWFGTDSFTVTVTDDLGGTTNQVISISAAAVNQPAVVGGGDRGEITEDADVVDGTLRASGLLTISDPDDGESGLQAASVAGRYGTLTSDNTGSWTYVAANSDAAIQALDAGETVVENFVVTTTDGTAHAVSIAINGAEDAAVISATQSSAAVGGGLVAVQGTLSIQDPDTSDNPVGFDDVGPRPSANGFGQFEMREGAWTYTLNNGNAVVQALEPGQTLLDKIEFTASDGSTEVVYVTIVGAPGGAALAGATPGELSTDDTADDYDWLKEVVEVAGVPADADEQGAAIDDAAIDEKTGNDAGGDILNANVGLASMFPIGESVYVTASGAEPATPPDRRDGPRVAAATDIAPAVPVPETEAAEDFSTPETPTELPPEEQQANEQALREAMQSMREEMKDAAEDAQSTEKMVDIGLRVSGTALSTGSLAWLLRSASLFASALSAVPTWKSFDPLPVLARKKQRKLNQADSKDTSQSRDDACEAAVGRVLDSTRGADDPDPGANRERTTE